MTVADYCILVACVLPLLAAVMAKFRSFGKRRKDGGYDNENPREWLARLSGWQARANAAQANSFEALPFFIGGVLVAQQAHIDQSHVDKLALAFIACRVVYIALYVANKGSLRSMVWAIGYACCVAMFF